MAGEDTAREIAEIKGRLAAALRARAEAEGPDPLEGRAGESVMVADEGGNVVRVDTARVEEGRLFIGGYHVIDPEDQAVDGEETEIGEDELLAMPVETVRLVAEYFGADEAPAASDPQPVGWQIVGTGSDDPPEGMATYEIYPLDFVLGWLYARKQAGEGARWRLLPVFQGDVQDAVFVTPT